MNVTIYGDSIFKGILLINGRYTINREWEKRLSDTFGISLKNRSRFGNTINKALDLIRRDSGRKYEAGEIAVLEIGGNDCDYDWAEIAEDPTLDHDCKTPPQQFRNKYREAIREIRGSGRKPVLATLPPIHSERYLRFICRNGLSRDRILSWLGDVDAIYWWQKKYSDMVSEISLEENAKLIDLRKAFLKDRRPIGELLCADGIHPSRAGQKIIYNALCAGVV